MKKLSVFIMISSLLFMVGCGQSDHHNTNSEPVEIHIAAAASLTDVIKELAKAYQENHPNVKITFNFGSSGALQQAIENGGATDIFFSAARKQMDALEKSGNIAEDTRIDLLINEVVLIVPSDSKLDIKDFNDLTREDIKHIALGEPKGVPVGQYTEEILSNFGILDSVKKKAVYGSDVRQVLSWVEAGEADAGIVYATDAAIAGDKVKIIAEAPDSSHKPIIYPAAIIKNSKQINEAKDFLNFLQNDNSKKTFKKYGFKIAQK